MGDYATSIVNSLSIPKAIEIYLRKQNEEYLKYLMITSVRSKGISWSDINRGLDSQTMNTAINALVDGIEKACVRSCPISALSTARDKGHFTEMAIDAVIKRTGGNICVNSDFFKSGADDEALKKFKDALSKRYFGKPYDESLYPDKKEPVEIISKPVPSKTQSSSTSSSTRTTSSGGSGFGCTFWLIVILIAIGAIGGIGSALFELIAQALAK